MEYNIGPYWIDILLLGDFLFYVDLVHSPSDACWIAKLSLLDYIDEGILLNSYFHIFK